MPKRIFKLTLLFAAISIPAVGFLCRAPGVWYGLLLGLAVAILGFATLTKLVVKWTDSQYRGGALTSVLIVVKMMATLGIVGVAFWVWHLPAVAFLVGYGNLLLAMVIAEGFLSGEKKV